MAVTFQRPRGRRRLGPLPHRARRHGRARYVVVSLVVLVIAVAAVAAILLRGSHTGLKSDPQALAKVSLPLGGGRIESVSAVTGPHSDAVPVTVRADRIWPIGTVPAGELISLDVRVRRPGWLGWLTGSTERRTLTVRAPQASVRDRYVTVGQGSALRVSFTVPVTEVLYGSPHHLTRVTLSHPSEVAAVPHTGLAGSTLVEGIVRAWERTGATLVSWFPAGESASAIASPAPGSRITPATPIRLTFSRPVAQALGHALPPVSPAGAGAWHLVNSHTIVFQPSGYGFGLGSRVSIGLPAGIRLVSGSHTAAGTSAVWHVPPGSTLRLQELLAQLGYLPLNFTTSGAPVAQTPAAEESAAVAPPPGSFSWRYPNVPADLHSMWAPGSAGELTRGAVMAFENDQGLTADGDAGPVVWRALIRAAVSGRGSTFGYTFVDVSKEASPEQLTLWHNGQTVLTTPVNTGIAQAPTASGTFAVYEHLRVTTMSGTNPDGTTYHDPGIQFVSYFNGGDALHAFTRAQYGFPQSLGCVEMPLGAAGQVWPYTPIGTIVHVA